MSKDLNLAGLIKKEIKEAESLIKQIEEIIKVENTTNRRLNSLINKDPGTKEACQLRALKSSSCKHDLSVKMEVCLKHLIKDLEKKLHDNCFDKKQKNKLQKGLDNLKKDFNTD